jgi:hypothetical protein
MYIVYRNKSNQSVQIHSDICIGGFIIPSILSPNQPSISSPNQSLLSIPSLARTETTSTLANILPPFKMINRANTPPSEYKTVSLSPDQFVKTDLAPDNPPISNPPPPCPGHRVVHRTNVHPSSLPSGYLDLSTILPAQTDFLPFPVTHPFSNSS